MQITYFPNPLLEVEVVLTPEVHLVVNTYAGMVEERAKDLVQVRTGQTRDSIHVESTSVGEPAAADVVASTPWSGYLEFGTFKMPAFPFLRPALDGVIPGRTD